MPSSVSRSIVTFAPSTRSVRALVSWGSASSSASMAGTAPVVPSLASSPARIRSNSPTVPITLASALAVCTAHEPCSAGSVRCTARSTPMDSALRMASVARCGPMHTAVTSPPCASCSCRAASTARSLISSSTASADARSSVKSDPESLRSE
jgi:hypothetical protein